MHETPRARDNHQVSFDPGLADRLRDVLRSQDGVTEKAMFGGLAFLIHGNMAVAASAQGGLLLRVDPADTARLTADNYADRAVMRGRPMDGWLRVGPEAVETDEELATWTRIGVDRARKLSPK